MTDKQTDKKASEQVLEPIGNVEIIQQLIDICTESLKTDVLSEGLKCECGRQIGQQIDLWEPIGRSSTYMIRNTLKSMIECGMIKDNGKTL